MKGSSVIKWLFALVVVLIIGFFGFVFKVNEGQCAVVTRFGAVRTQVTQAGMYLRLPWPLRMCRFRTPGSGIWIPDIWRP